jgi:hypothetical protein
MSVALMGPIERVAESGPDVLVSVATVGGAILAIWALGVRFRKTWLSQAIKRRFLVPLWRALYAGPHEERLARERAEADQRVDARFTRNIDPKLDPIVETLASQSAQLEALASTIEGIAHSTNGKAPGEKTMSAEVSALTVAVKQITDDLSARKVVDATVADLVGRVAALEGKQNDPHPQPPTANPLPHRRHDDT